MNRVQENGASKWKDSAVLTVALLVAGAAMSTGQGKSTNPGNSEAGRSPNGQYAIGLWGDLPYSDVQAQTGVPNLIADMNGQDLVCTVHDGDLKAATAHRAR
jgi:hypothetical protein